MGRLRGATSPPSASGDAWRAPDCGRMDPDRGTRAPDPGPESCGGTGTTCETDRARITASEEAAGNAALDGLEGASSVDEAATLLRTTRRAIYAMIERRQLPGVIRIRRRVLFRADDLLHWLDQKRAPSPEE